MNYQVPSIQVPDGTLTYTIDFTNIPRCLRPEGIGTNTTSKPTTSSDDPTWDKFTQEWLKGWQHVVEAQTPEYCTILVVTMGQRGPRDKGISIEVQGLSKCFWQRLGEIKYEELTVLLGARKFASRRLATDAFKRIARDFVHQQQALGVANWHVIYLRDGMAWGSMQDASHTK